MKTSTNGKTDLKIETPSKNGTHDVESRLEIQKTYKIYIGGEFPRTESGRFYPIYNSSKKIIANMCLSSRKDFRNAEVSARTAQSGWASKSAFNRSQILYRIAEMFEGRKAQFIAEMMEQGLSEKSAKEEVYLSIDRIVYYAGWSDKYQAIASTVNPVASSHFNFSIPEPTGVVVALAGEESPILGLVSTIIPVIAGGNAVIALASESKPLCAITFAEVINSSDVPGGVVNILTGKSSELHGHFSSHMDVNAVLYARKDNKELKTIQENAANNVKRVLNYSSKDFSKESEQSPYYILDFQEIKTTWHPIENIGASKGGY